jgi:hypothetical protein
MGRADSRLGEADMLEAERRSGGGGYGDCEEQRGSCPSDGGVRHDGVGDVGFSSASVKRGEVQQMDSQ